MGDDPYHEGEIAIQLLAGERETAARHGSLVGSTILVPALPFVSRQSLLAAAASDDDGNMWCSVWCGAPGFVHTTDATAVTIARALDHTSKDDPVRRLVRPGAELGLLVIELGTRKRLRINGIVADETDDELHMTVRESFPNCPKYIQKRRLIARGREGAAEHDVRGDALDAERRDFVERVDTMFVGSRHPSRGPDASHRGGAPGFLRVLDERTIRVPDYPGNGMFQTLGNLHVEPRAGLALVDFERSRLLVLTGAVVIHHDQEEPSHPTGGTGRYWDFTVTRWRELALPGAFDWELVDRSPQNPPPAGREV
jgi:uncharacterized protein